MELKSEELLVLRNGTAAAAVDGVQVAPFFDLGDGPMCMKEVGDLKVFGMVISRDTAQFVRARLRKVGGGDVLGVGGLLALHRDSVRREGGVLRETGAPLSSLPGIHVDLEARRRACSRVGRIGFCVAWWACA